MKGDLANKEVSIGSIMDSQEKYCGVIHMLKKILPVTWEIWFNGVMVYNN